MVIALRTHFQPTVFQAGYFEAACTELLYIIV